MHKGRSCDREVAEYLQTSLGAFLDDLSRFPVGDPVMKFKIFKGTLIGWKELFQQAADFASELGPRKWL